MTPLPCPDSPGRTSPACPGRVSAGAEGRLPAGVQGTCPPPRAGLRPRGYESPFCAAGGERRVRCRVPATAPENPILTLGRDRPRLFLPAGREGRGSRVLDGLGGPRVVQPGGAARPKGCLKCAGPQGEGSPRGGDGGLVPSWGSRMCPLRGCCSIPAPRDVGTWPKAQSFTIESRLWMNHLNVSNGCRKTPRAHPAPLTPQLPAERPAGGARVAQRAPRPPPRNQTPATRPQQRRPHRSWGIPAATRSLGSPNPAVTLPPPRGRCRCRGRAGSRMRPGGRAAAGSLPSQAAVGAGRAAGPKPPDGNNFAPDALRFPGNRAVRASLFCQEPGRAPTALPLPGPSAAPAGQGCAGGPVGSGEPSPTRLDCFEPGAARGAATSCPLSGHRGGLL